MTTPVPKPRTKFGTESLSPSGNSQNQTPELSPTPGIQNATNIETEPSTSPSEVPKPAAPTVPPRPPVKPPRTAIQNSAAIQNYGNVLGELRLNLGETSPQQPPEIGFLEVAEEAPPIFQAPKSPPPPLSPPTHQAPPRPPPPAGWKPMEMVVKPNIPERISSRPLPSLPDAIEPSTSSQQTIENPVYLGLDTYRSLSRMSSGPPTHSPNCDQLREWLSEEENEESNRPENLNSNIPTSSNQVPSEENPYTPCPRRSDFLGSTLDPFEDEFFLNSTKSPSNQNLYVSPQFEQKNAEKSPKLDDAFLASLENVVEACVTPVSNSKAPEYVNVPPPNYPNCEDPGVDSFGFPTEETMHIDGSSITFVGFVNMTGHRKEKRLHCRLRNMQLSFHEDEESTECIHGPFDVKDFYLFRQNPTDSSVVIHIGEKKTQISFIPEDPSNLWMFFISESWLSIHSGLTPALRDAESLRICGMVWIKYGSMGDFKYCAAGINNMSLYYVLADQRDRVLKRNSSDGAEVVAVDLRKIMALREKCDKSENCTHVKHKRGSFSISLHGITFFIDSRDEQTTSYWFEAIDSILKKPAGKLENLRLTGDNIPVIVDKCIRFVAIHGINEEGIYRRNGKVTEAKTIMTKLTEDPVGYYLAKETDETVYAVADVLRQFFRKLDEPLFPKDLQQELLEIGSESQKYSDLFKKLPTVHYATLRKLIGHLRDVSSHAEKNRASVENLAKVFAASLFMSDSTDENVFSDKYSHQINTMIQLINGYDVIFKISLEEELSRQMISDAEKKQLHVKKPCTDWMVAIHVWEKENRPFNVTVNLASEEVVREAIVKRGFDGPPDSPYAVFEVICDGNLVRRLPSSEKMSKSVLQWIGWECKDGFLLFDHDKFEFDEADVSYFTGKIKVAEPGSKSFKTCEVKIENGTSIVICRQQKAWKSWPIEDVIWYVGADASRKSPNPHNVTMISTANDAFSHKLPGFCLSFKEEVERTRWMTALNRLTCNTYTEKLVHI